MRFSSQQRDEAAAAHESWKEELKIEAMELATVSQSAISALACFGSDDDFEAAFELDPSDAKQQFLIVDKAVAALKQKWAAFIEEVPADVREAMAINSREDGDGDAD